MSKSDHKSRMATLLIGHAVVWAVLILGLSWIYGRNNDFGENMVLIMVCLFTVSSGFLTAALRRSRDI